MTDTELQTRDEGLAEKIQWVNDTEDATRESNQAAERDRDYYDNKQWADDEIAALKKRGQAPIVFNLIKRKVDFLRGVERRMRTDPKAFPRTPVHEEDADSATDAIRYVCDNNDWDQVRSRGWDNLVIEGVCGCDVVVESEGDTLEVKILYTSWDRIGYDPHAREPDFSDARYKFLVIWMDEEEAKETWPDKIQEIEGAYSGSTSETYDDVPKHNIWADKKRRRIRIVQMQFLEDGIWLQCTFSAGGFLEDAAPSPYLDEFGQPEASLILDSAFIDRDNNRYGYIRPMIWPQDEVNKRRSKALHAINSKRVIASGEQTLGDGGPPDINRVRTEVARPDAFIVNPPGGEFRVEADTEMAAGQVTLLNEAVGAIQSMGPNEAQTGNVTGESGRAIQAKQQGGFIEIEPLTDSHKRWSRAVYRAAWNRIRQFWTGERWIRVTDDLNNLRWVGMNTTLATQLQQMPPEDAAFEMQRLQLVPNDPRLNEVVANNPAELDVDIVLDEGPDLVTLQDEEFDRLAVLFERGIIPAEHADLLVEASSLRSKGAILERMRGAEEDQEQQAEQAEMAEQERRTALTLEFADKAAEIDNTKADTQKKQTEAAENIADTRDTTMDAETKRRQLGLSL